jgi:cation diffusion facilitator CzcD-associated flavoprotein CzcO
MNLTTTKLTGSKAHSYQYTFSPNPNWSSFYAPAQEIREYLESVVRKYSVERFIKCSHKVVDARWDDKRAKWCEEYKREV